MVFALEIKQEDWPWEAEWPREEGAVDAIVRLQDGWSLEDIAGLAVALDLGALVHMECYPERLIAEMGASLCLHPQQLRIVGGRREQEPIWNGSVGIPPPPPYLDTERLQRRGGGLCQTRVCNDSRFPAFVEFLINTFGGYAGLSRGSGVMDVAGGAGGLAFELTVRRGIRCVVVDPREVRLNKNQRSVLEFRKRSCAELESGLSISPLARSMHQHFQPRELKQLQVMFESTEVVAGAAEGQIGGVAEALCNCSVVVGLHPDQALDHIVDAAIALRKPFAVVPCCVFWKHAGFAHRRTPTGKHVKTYDELCDYIGAKVDGVREVSLDFPGLNRVFFWHPP